MHHGTVSGTCLISSLVQKKKLERKIIKLKVWPANTSCAAISIRNYIDPGAGLKHLEDWVQDSDFIFDSLFMNSTGPAVAINGYAANLSGAGTPSQAIPMVRTYQSDAAM